MYVIIIPVNVNEEYEENEETKSVMISERIDDVWMDDKRITDPSTDGACILIAQLCRLSDPIKKKEKNKKIYHSLSWYWQFLSNEHCN